MGKNNGELIEYGKVDISFFYSTIWFHTIT